jgi:hypothetical protein
MAIKNKKEHVKFVHAFSREKIEEVSNMTLRARLQWLEEANSFINKALGYKKRAIFDERFRKLK